jgi:2-polyprenyl-3-methyl-5-hydroxy-6-metoxy-1,4-benzoquinol methylase
MDAFMPLRNINTPEYWNEIWQAENGPETWRKYPITHSAIELFCVTGKRILEIGSGPGVLLKRLKEHGNTVYGIDISQVAVDFLHSQGMAGRTMKVPPLPEDYGDFDIVIGCELLEHLNFPEKLMLEVKRVLKPGGKAVFTVPNNCFGNDVELEHMQRFNEKKLKEMLLAIGPEPFLMEFTEFFEVENAKTIKNGKFLQSEKATVRLPVLLGCVEKVM